MEQSKIIDTLETYQYFGTKTRHVKENALTIQTVGIYMPTQVPLLIGRYRPSKRVSRREACEQTAAPADRAGRVRRKNHSCNFAGCGRALFVFSFV